MNLYDRWILPPLLDLVMRNKEMTRYRARVVPQARGIELAGEYAKGPRPLSYIYAGSARPA